MFVGFAILSPNYFLIGRCLWALQLSAQITYYGLCNSQPKLPYYRKMFMGFAILSSNILDILVDLMRVMNKCPPTS